MSLLNRIRPDIAEIDILNDELRKFDAGSFGESYILKILQQEFGNTFTHFQNYKLFGNEMDLISVTADACYLFEIKNIRGHVYITNSPPQLIRTTQSGSVDILKSPITQLAMNHRKLQRFLTDNNITLPIHAAVIFAFHTAKITSESNDYPIVIGRDVCYFVEQAQLPRSSPHEKLVNLLQQHLPAQSYLPKLAKYQLNLAHIRTGVFCPSCQHLPMIRRPHTWYCPNCHITSHNAHIAAHDDYYDLIFNKITNSECRQYLHLRNRYEARRILTAICVAKSGAKRNRTYTIKY